MATWVIGLLEDNRDTVARHHDPVFMPELGCISFPLLLVNQDKFQMLLEACVDISKLLQVLRLSEAI